MKIRELFIISLIAMCTSCGESGHDKEDLRSVRYKKVEMADGIRVRTYAGQVRSGMESKLSFRVHGVINHLDVKIGDVVTKGQVIARLDPRDFDLKVQEAEASLLQSKAQMRHAAASYTRYRELYETRSTSRNELDASRAESESAAAAVEAMQKKLALTRSQLSYTTLTVPANGTIADVLVEQNETVSRGEPVVVLNSDSDIEVHVSLPEILVTEVKKGNQVAIAFGSLPGQNFTGYVSEIGVSSETGTTFLVIVELPVSPKGVRSGMSAEVQFVFYDPNELNHIYVPPIAVKGSGNENYVYLVNPLEDGVGVVEIRMVKVGDLTNSGLKVIEGIKDGDLIVTAGWQSIVNGQRVKL